METVEIVMTNLNGLPRSWDSFIQGICDRKKLVKFSRLWEELSQEEKMGSEDQSLTVHSKKTKRSSHHSRGKEFKALIENHTEKKIKTFRSDNGGEFTSNDFK